MKKAPLPADVPAYIAGYPPPARKILSELRSLIRTNVPEAEEKISYGMAGYKYHGMFAYFAGHTNHVGFYPGVGAVVQFKSKLKSYTTSKGTVQLPLGQPIPSALIKDMLQWMKKDKEAKALLKRKK